MRVAIYARVSTAGKGQDTEVQARELREYASRRGWETVEEFTDTGISGSKESRPALDRLLIDARRRKFDAVLVYRYDKFARSLGQLVNALDEFDALGIHFVSLHESLDTSTPTGRLVFGIQKFRKGIWEPSWMISASIRHFTWTGATKDDWTIAERCVLN